MKNKLLKAIAMSTTVFALGAAVLSSQSNKAEILFAAQHVENFADYTYSGNYYSTITGSLTEGLDGSLRKSLSTLILPKAWYGYQGSASNALGTILQSADEDPTNKSNMILLYTRDSIKKSASTVNGTLIWNREHTWPQNLSNGHWGKEKAGADLLHIRPTYEKTNSARGNTRYGDNGKKGVQKYEGMEYAYTSGGYFEPLDSVKGDIARIIMYVWTAYYDYYGDTNLKITKAFDSYDTLLKWHTMDKPDALEGHRNDFAESSDQKNRNPFVDHPEYAWKIFGDSASAAVKEQCKAAYPGNGQVTPPSPTSSNPTTTSTPTTTSEATSTPSSSEPTEPVKKGCNGSIIVVSSITGFSALVGLVIVCSKKKKK